MANPAAPIKTTIRDAMVERLRLVRRANGFWTEMGLNVAVDRKPIQAHRAGELPRPVVTWGQEARATPEAGAKAPAGCLGAERIACPFFVYVVVGGKRGEIQDAMDRADQDVKRAFPFASTVGGALLFRWIGSTTDQQILVAEDAGAIVRAQIAVTFEAQYDMTATAA